jgi:hypothetical protein
MYIFIDDKVLNLYENILPHGENENLISLNANRIQNEVNICIKKVKEIYISD